MKKKILTLAVLVLAIATLFACADQGQDGEVLRVGMDLKFPPFSYLDDDGNPAGLEPLIANAFAEYLGMEVEIVNTDFALLIPALQSGDVDILIPDMSKTEERAQQVDFSDPYRFTQSFVLVNKDFALENNVTDEMPAQEFFDLPGQDFIGLAGTFGVLVPQQYGAEVEEVTEIGLGILEVANGQATALVASSEIYQFNAQNKDTTIVYSNIGNFTGSAFVVEKGNTELLEKSNEFIATMYEEGGLFDQIREEYDAIISEFLQNDELGLDFIVQMPEGYVH